MGVMPTVGRAEVTIVADARGFARDVEQQVNNELRNVDVSDGGRSVGRSFTGGMKETVTRNSRRSFRQAAVDALESFGVILQGGISRSAAAGFGVALVALLVPVTAAAGATVAGAFVLAFGAGFAAIPLIVSAQTPAVQKRLEEFGSFVKTFFTELSGEFNSVWATILDTAHDVLSELEPTLSTAFENLAPVIADFAEQFGDALLELEPAIQPMLEAFSELLEEIGPILINEVFPDLSDALINLADAVSENAPMLADMLTTLMQIPEVLINFIAELTRLAAWFSENPEVLIVALTAIAAAFIALSFPISAVIGIVLALGAAFLFFKDKIGAALERVKEIIVSGFTIVKETITNVWNSILEFLSGIWDAIVAKVTNTFSQARDAVVNRITQIKNDIEAGWNTVVDFIGGLGGRISRKASGMWDGLWTSFRSAINDIIRGWNSLEFSVPGKETPFGTIGGFSIGTPTIPTLQEGGIIRQAGIAIVGDDGPEAVSFNQGAVVQPLPETMDTASRFEEDTREFEATAVIDLGHDIQRVIDLTFRRVVTDARAGQRRTVAA